MPWLVVILVVTGEGAGFADRVALAVPNGWGAFARNEEWTGIVALFFICSWYRVLQIQRSRGRTGIELAGDTFTLGTAIAALQLIVVASIARWAAGGRTAPSKQRMIRTDVAVQSNMSVLAPA